MEWDDKTIARLRDLWAEGHSTAAIGRKMGVSKNAVVGKSHRLDLPARPSPIPHRIAREKPPEPDRRVKLQSLPPLASVDTPLMLAGSSPASPSSPTRTVRPVFVAPPPKPPTPMPYRRVSQCSYVTNIGHWGVGITYCDEPTARGPYCQHHGDLCLVRVRPRGEVADAAD